MSEVSEKEWLTGGVDYLKGRFFGTLKCTEIFKTLQVNKEMAESAGDSRVVRFGGVEFSISPNAGGGVGKSRVRFWLEFAGVRIGICDEKYRDDESVPIGWFEVRGEPLSRLGYVNCKTLILQALDALGVELKETKLSRVDLRHDFFDFTPGEVHKAAVAGKMVTRFSSYVTYGTSPTNVQTVQLGKRGTSPVICRFYDKWAEAGSSESKRDFVKDVLCGGEHYEVVTRVEFEVNRTGLLKRCIDSLEDLEGGMKRLTTYLTCEYLTMSRDAVDRGNNNQGRAVVSKGWNKIIRAFLEHASTFAERPQKVIKRKIQSFTQAKNTVVGYLAKMFALGDRSAVNAFPVAAGVYEIFDMFELSDFQKRIDEKRKQLDWVSAAERALWRPKGQRFMEFGGD